jgi:hypothetical protein
MAACLLALFLLTSCASLNPWPSDVRRSLAEAAKNRAELEKVLRHYRNLGDERKLEAAEFLIANMKDAGYSFLAAQDENRNEVPFNALDHKNLAEAEAAWDALEKKYGPLDFTPKRFDKDLEFVRASFLIENIDLAFKAWREKPWARDLTFETFKEYVLPYRGSNEPLNPWRKACMERYAGLEKKMTDPTDAEEAGRLIREDVQKWVGFDSLYYMHPTDQGFNEMSRSRKGRCEDISNMMAFAMRANAIPSSADFTPFWADRDNNHAWEVILDAQGRAKAGLSNRAAKIYRKVFSIQPGSLGVIKDKDEEVPPYIGGKTYLDVTAHYVPVSDVAVDLETSPMLQAKRAYVCVFNGGEWQAVHWGNVRGGKTTFTGMGRNIAYLPAYYVDKKFAAAAPAFILTKEGRVHPLDGGGNQPPTRIGITATKPTTADADTRKDLPMMTVSPGKSYELFYWDGKWVSLGKRTAGAEPVTFDSVPSNRLLWLVEEGSRKLERIFTIEEGRQVWW